MPGTDREALPASDNPLGLEGLEYVEYATPRPQALGQLLEQAGFHPVARHRSREVLLYRQGGMHVVVNAQAGVVHGTPMAPDAAPRISAVALRVRDAAAAWRQACELGAWELPAHAAPMELNIPGIHGPGGSHLYFVDRWREFSIFDIDFQPIPGVAPAAPPAAALHVFGLVQYIGRGRTADWVDFYGRLFGFRVLPPQQRFGILPKGTVLQSPADAAAGALARFHLQLIEPEGPEGGEGLQARLDEPEAFQRLGLGTRDVPAAVAAWRAAGLAFVDAPGLAASTRGAVTQPALGSVVFELVHDERG